MQTSEAGLSVLGLFPRFGENHLGGIQASATVAWEAIAKGNRAELLLYSREGVSSNRNGNVTNDSRVRTILAALNRKSAPELIVVWQIGLLKLLPFLRNGSQRVILFLHGIEAWRQPDWLTQRLCQKVDLFLSNSDYTWNRFLSYNPALSAASHLTIPLGIGNPVGTSVKPPAKCQALMLSRLSRAEDYKGHREVIDAWPLVLERHEEARLVIAGAGDLQHDLETVAASRGVSQQVRFVGAVSETEKERLLQESRCLLMPSAGEGFGLVYLEAMRLGRPCLVSQIDAGREVVAPPTAGLAVDTGNQEQVAESICKLLQQGGEWDTWSSSAKRRYEENFTAQKFQERLTGALFH